MSAPQRQRWWAVVPAAGQGKRMGADIPKQYLSIGGETLLSRSVKRLLKSSRLEQVAVAVFALAQRRYYLGTPRKLLPCSYAQLRHSPHRATDDHKACGAKQPTVHRPSVPVIGVQHHDH